MKFLRKDERNITIEMSHEQALMILALVRETCFGSVMHGFETRVGYPSERVGEISKELFKLLDNAGISE